MLETRVREGLDMEPWCLKPSEGWVIERIAVTRGAMSEALALEVPALEVRKVRKVPKEGQEGAATEVARQGGEGRVPEAKWRQRFRTGDSPLRPRTDL